MSPPPNEKDTTPNREKEISSLILTMATGETEAFNSIQKLQELDAINKADKEGRTALHYAAQLPKLPSGMHLVDKLLKAGAHPNLQDKEGKTPLHHAAESKNKNYTIVSLLVKAGADATITDKRGKKPGYYTSSNATPENNLEVVAVSTYLSIRNSANLKDKNDQTSLHRAAIAGKADEIRRLIANGADPSAKDKQGNIPLHYAVQQSSESGRLEVIIALVGRDDESIIAAPYNVYEFYNQFYSKNKDGNTPYDLASSQNFPDMDASPKSLLKEEHLNKTQMVGKAVMAVAVAALAVGIALSAWWVALAAAAVIGGLLLAEEYAKKKLNPLEVKIENTSMNEIGEGRISFAKSVESSPQVDPNQKGGGRDL